MPNPNDVIRVKWPNGNTTLMFYGYYLAFQRSGADFQKMAATIIKMNNQIVESQRQQAAQRQALTGKFKNW
jgi:hypothetical protein